MSGDPVIFVIEDSPIIGEIIQTVMEEDFHARAVLFSSAEEAIEAYDLCPPEVIILDYKLDSWEKDNMTGTQFLDWLKEHVDSIVPVIAVTGQKKKTVAVELIDKGVVDYLDKNEEDFFEKLKESVQQTLDIIHYSSDIQKNGIKASVYLLMGIFLIVVPVFFLLLFLIFKK